MPLEETKLRLMYVVLSSKIDLMTTEVVKTGFIPSVALAHFTPP